MNPPRRPPITTFAVEDTAVQLTWRGLAAGPLTLRAFADDGSGGRPVAADVQAEVGALGAGAVVVPGLPPDTALRIEATLPGADRSTIDLRTRTLPTPEGVELTRLATIGDLHLGTEVFGQQGTIREVPTPEVPHPIRCADAAVDEAVAWGAERFVVKGDVTNHGQVDEWRHYARLVRRAPVPVDALPGNHDRAYTRAKPGLPPEDAARAFGFAMALPVLVRDLPGLRLVLLDSTTGGWNFGHVDPFADEVVQAVADADPSVSVLVVLHHQLQPHLLSEGWPIGVSRDESVRFLDRLAAAHQRVVVTSGHTHRHRRWDHGDVIATQVGSTKDYPGVWAGYVAHERGLRQVVRRVERPDCLRWTEHTRRAALGVWRWVSPGLLSARCFSRSW